MTDDGLYDRVARILEQARGQVARTVNTTMVQAYWQVGREIAEDEQAGEQPASDGDENIKHLAARLKGPFGKGFEVENLKRMKQSVACDARSPISFPPVLAWSHYLVLMRVANEHARAFYEREAARECWSVRQLERQIGAQLFERLSRHRDPEEVRALARRGQEVATPTDVIKDPFVLEFLDLGEHPALHERDVEQVIIERLEAFLLEMGKGFCFVGRQKRLTIESDHFYVDLVFYNRLLRCFVLIDLKLGKLTHQDLGQMQMYVNYFDRTQRGELENKTIGIVLCSEQNAAMVKITLPEDNEQIIAATYLQYLPSEAELQAELERERAEAERVLRLTAPSGTETAGS
jgi:predicted nuclease of restriction endonuclease-like (RecB) superfamily